ncbi:hypothetical protein SDC9_69078 [bioreactor metagenome]|uniref:Uncharacterized protein n=1 Tax=bioreactor metagenome TaxID=1076179 RepID=A0A644Y3X3_9ZZZZ
MAPDMMDRDQGFPPGKSHGLRKAQPHKHRADQPWRVGDRHRVDVILSAGRVLQRPLRQGRYGLHMLPGGDLRHHAAVQRVHVRLRGDGVG